MLAATIRAFIRDNSGATAMEYALLAALIGVAIVGTFAALGNSIDGLFNNGTTQVLDNQAASIN